MSSLTKKYADFNRYEGQVVATYTSEPFVRDIDADGKEIFATVEVNVRVCACDDEMGYVVTTDDDADGQDEGPDTLFETEAEATAAAVAFANRPKAAAIIAAIESGLKAGGDDKDWNAPEFEQARDLTGAAGCVWDFVAWKHALNCVERYGKLGGVEFAQEVR